MLDLLEPADAAELLGLSASRVRCMADEGVLRIAALTPRGLRLFLEADVLRLKATRARSKPRTVPNASVRPEATDARLIAGAQ
jgi:DNA-binding transcriptional MerR regulator